MRSKISECISQRYILTLMGFLGVANAYIMRACLSIAIIQMAPNNVTSDVSTHLNSQHTTKAGSFDWDQETQGWILSAFYIGYIVTHVPGGLLAQRFGGKHTLGLGILSTAVFTLLTPAAANLGPAAMIALRVLMGLGEGTTFPALSTLLAQWAPPLERSRLSSFVFAGVQIGTVVSTSASGVILQYMDGGWPNVFYIFGSVGVIWFIFWCILCYSDPSSHPFISDSEKEYLRSTIGNTERNKDLGGTPWKALLCSWPVWALIIAEVGHDYGLYTMVTDLPKYMNDVLHYQFSETGFLSALPYLVMWIASLVIGYVADQLIAKEIIGLTLLRRILATIGAVGPAVGVLAASYCEERALVVSLFTIGMGLMGFCYASLRVNSLDLSPNYAGTIMALVNGLGSLSGVVAPTLIGYLTPNGTASQWQLVFWVMFGVLLVTNIPFMIFGSGQVQTWNEPRSFAEPDFRRRSTFSSGEPIRAKHVPQSPDQPPPYSETFRKMDFSAS